MNSHTIIDPRIDAGKPFDFGKISQEYALYRDIYPEIFYQKIISRGLCVSGQNVLDLGTGTGVLPRHMYRYGARWTGTDISAEQIGQAKQLAQISNMDIAFHSIPAEDIEFSDETFDIVTACQCFEYFDHSKLIPKLSKCLRPDGKLLILYMAWLPFRDPIAQKSETLVLKYNPQWTGANETVRPIPIPDIVYEYFHLTDHEEYILPVPFTKETWHGRMKACRGVGASLTEQALAQWDIEHKMLLDKIAPDKFEILHYAALAVLSKK